MEKTNLINKPECSSLKVLGTAYSGSREFVHLYLEPPVWDFNPGQFVMLRSESWGLDPLWPRPFSICEKTTEYMRIFIQVVGRGTRLLSLCDPGSRINVSGPLGRGFILPEGPLLILAGGMGIAPFVGLCKNHPDPQKISMLFGHRLALKHYPFEELPEEMHKESMRQVSEDDLKTFARVLGERIREFVPKGEILACGPMPFLKIVQLHALACKALAQISVETKMACGIGACLGCVVKTKDEEMIQSCLHGPVFAADKIIL